MNDFRFAGRLLLKDRWFAVVAIVALGLGIGVNNTFFTLVNTFCLRGLPMENPDRVAYVAARDPRGARGLSYPDFLDVRSGARAFSGIAAFASAPATLSEPGIAADRINNAYISAGAFRLLGERPLLGREFGDDDDRVGAPATVILTNRIWTTRYGGDPSVVGRTVMIDGAPAVVIGVMRGRFAFPGNADVWQPLALMRGIASQPRDARGLGAFARLTDGVTLGQAAAEIDAVASNLAGRHPQTNAEVRLTIVPINERYNARLSDPAWMAFITAGVLVLLIACANVANLMMMQAAQRSREIAVRVSLGAARLRIVRQLLVESALLAALGGLLGAGLSIAGIRLLTSIIPDNTLPYWTQFTMDGRVFAVLVTVCLGSVFVFGLVPALHASRFDGSAARHGRGTAGSVGARRWTAVFLTAEFALTVVLLAAVASGERTSRALAAAETPIDTARLLTMWLTLPNEKYSQPAQHIDAYRRIDERLGAIGAVSSATIATALPPTGAASRQVAIDGRTIPDSPPTVLTLGIEPDYFETIEIPLLRGRPFTDLDGSEGQESAIVNDRFAAAHFPGADPIGQRIRLMAPGTANQATPWAVIVGVAPNMRHRVNPDVDPVVYMPLRSAPPAAAVLLVRGTSDPEPLAPILREELRVFDRDVPADRVMTLEQAVNDTRWNPRISVILITSISTIALILAVVGLYAVTAYTVKQRSKEIAVRVALGAQPRNVRWLVLRRALFQLGIGMVAGVACTLVWERLFSPPDPARAIPLPAMSDPQTLLQVGALMGVVALVACLVPARRAALLDPIGSLRHE